MATVNKDFRIKHGLVVEGTNGTINGEDILTTGSTTDSLDEGSTNQYFTDARAKDSAAALLTGASLTNITITGTGNDGLVITAENGVADSTTDDLDEGTTNKYFTDARARQALSGGTGITYNDSTGEIVVDTEVIASKQYVDSIAAGLTWKPAVNLLSTSNVPLTGNTGTVVIDGHDALTSAETSYRLLLIGQSSAAENGIYLYTDNGTTYTLTRPADLDTVAELDGAAVFVIEGTQYAATAWVQANHYATTFADQEWDQFSGSGTYTGGVGINLDGNIIEVDFTEFDTDDISEGTTNKYYTDQRVKDLLTGSTQTNISITEVDGDLIITAENGVDDSTTDDLDEGSTNKYFTDQRAVDAVEAVTLNLPALEINSIVKNIALSTLVESSTTPEAVATFPKASYRSAKFLVKAAFGNHTHVSEVMLTLDSSDNIAITEYAMVQTDGSLMDLTADISGTDVRLLADVSNNNTTVNIYGTLIA